MQGDDEVGLLIVRRWQEEHGDDYSSKGIEIQLLESPGLNLLGALAGLDAAVLVDAVQSGAPAGTIHELLEKDLEGFQESIPPAQRWGAAETLSLGRRLVPEDLPEQLVIIGIEGAVFTLGEGLSPAVRAAIPEALDLINRTLDAMVDKKTPGTEPGVKKTRA